MFPSDPTSLSASKATGAAPPAATPDTPAHLAEALRSMAHEPLLPAEKKLIIASLLLGMILLGLLYGVCQLVFGSG